MSNFPTDFTNMTRSLAVDKLGDKEADIVRKLADKGFEVRTGLTPEFADQILVMAQESNIREYCPKDSTERFTDRAATERWLAKRRAVFLLLKRENDNTLSLVGYGWSGPGFNRHVPGGQTTFALRIGEAGQGQGLAEPFSWLIVAASAAQYDTQDFWLETWASNGAAVHIYHKLGFETVKEETIERPTAIGGTVADRRIYMQLPNRLLPLT
jgi:ribosomal protein S18 acetylase RimI-like enzyme